MWQPTYSSDELYHHGVMGMKWGVRRYQNYDGTYTAAGLKHYKKAEGAYDKANAKYKETKKAYKAGKVSKGELKRSQVERKYAKKIMSKEYDQLKQDKLADKGKERYASGKTITGNNAALDSTVGLLGMGASVAGYAGYMGMGRNVATKFGNVSSTTLIAAGLATGAAVLGVGGAVYNEHQAKKLRAYYGHSRPQFEKSLSKYTTKKNIELQKTKKYDNVYSKNHKNAVLSAKADAGDFDYFERMAQDYNRNLRSSYEDLYKKKKR